MFEAFNNNSKYRHVHDLQIWIDDSGILRCGGRLKNAHFSAYSTYSKLLPRSCHFNTLIIREFHLKLLHAGVSHTLAQICEEYWIPTCRAQVFKYICS